MEFPLVKIILVSYYQPEILEKVIKQLVKVTAYPNYKIIVADNKSENSGEIRERCGRLISEGIVDKAYFFKKNLMGNSTRYVVKDNLDCDIVCWGDYDAFILDPADGSCWLTDFVNCLSEDERALMLQFSAVNNPLFRKDLPPIKIDNSKSWTINGPANGHYLTVRRDFFIDYLQSSPTPRFVDGDFMNYTERKVTETGISYYRKRYDKNSVINLSSESCGISNLVGDIKADENYLKKRTSTLSGGLNEEGIGFLTYLEVDPSLVEVLN